MKIIFVLPPMKSPYSLQPEPPLGLAYLAACLLEYRSNLQIEIIDGSLLSRDNYYDNIINIEADIVGVSTTMSQLNQALMIPHMVKQKNIKFIIGGPGIYNLPSSQVYESGYSVICYGEGERTVVELVHALENGLPLKDIDGISYLKEGKEVKTHPREPIKNLDEIPFAARELLDMEKYIGTWKMITGVGVASAISSRGCPFSCRFCDKRTSGGKVRFMSPPKMIEEMKLLFEVFGAEMVFFEDDLFTANRRRVLEFCDLMEKELPGKIWAALSRVDTIDPQMLSRMKQAGCVELALGAESGSQKILDLLGKEITVNQIENAFRWVKETGIRAGMFLIIGVPGETQEDIEMTKRMILKLEPDYIDISYLMPIPGTEMHEMTKCQIKDGVDFSNYNLIESVYRDDLFEVEIEERGREIMESFLTAFKDKVNVARSICGGARILPTTTQMEEETLNN
ncbi:MAG: B12-binding domain-containing radical SAM protein [Methanotrichaceae archaeon]|nr:B12-binding domain-containing radical SAM protein [Methanotrichaceae archaeon]